MAVKYPDYSNSIVNLSCSILSYFGVDGIKHNTIPELDQILNERKPRNIAIMLFDGMGTSILDKHISKNAFLQKKIAKPISSTFPPTTVAATTAINTGLTPLETGWLGWITYYKEIDQNVVTFYNTLQSDNTIPAAPYHLGFKNMPYKSLSMMIREKNPDVHCCAVSPFKINATDETVIVHSIDEQCKALKELTSQEGKHFIYSYWGDPDHTMHDLGVDAKPIQEIVHTINEKVKKLSKTLGDDTLVIVTADHGHINSKWFFLCDYPELKSMLVRPHAIENRAASLFVKPGKKEEFRKLFRKLFADHFMLMEHDEFLSSGLLGVGTANVNVDSMVGDYVAVATDDYCLGETYEDKGLVGIHAGLTAEEMTVPLIIL